MRSIDCVFVIIGYNNCPMTRDCIESFLQHMRGIALWLYDNASAPALNELADHFHLPYFYSDKNLGFAGGANRAIEWILEQADARAVCIVNNDILISNDFGKCLQPELAGFLQDAHLAAMTPLLYADRDLRVPENFGILYYRSGLTFQNRTGKLDESALLNGAFLFLKTTICRQLMKEDGFIFQPAYFFNAEDVELCLRLLSRGFKLRVSPNIRVQHLGSQSLGAASTNSFYLAWRNLLWTLFITRSRPELLTDAPFMVAGQFVLLVLATLRGHPELLIRVYLETLRNRGRLSGYRRNFLRLKQDEFRHVIKPGVFPVRVTGAAGSRKAWSPRT